MASAVDAGLARAALRAGHARSLVNWLRLAALVYTRLAGSAAGVGTASFLALSIDAGAASATLAVKHAVVRWNRRGLAGAVVALAARSTVRLNFAALGGCGRSVRLARVTSRVTDETTGAVSLFFAVTSFGALALAAAVAARGAVARRNTGASRRASVLRNTASDVALEASRRVAVGVKARLVLLGAALRREQRDRTKERSYKRQKPF